MSLTVVTLTDGRSAWLKEAVLSVPAWAKKNIVKLEDPKDFQKVRWESTIDAGEYVAFLDHDDRLDRSVLARCVKALDSTGVGIAFTNEALIDENGKRVSDNHERKVSRRDIAMHPRSLHHLAVVRTSCLDPVILQHANRIGIGIDWLIRAYAALVHGAVHINAIGYEWRQYPEQTSRQPLWGEAYQKAVPLLREVTNSWLDMDQQVPQFFA